MTSSVSSAFNPLTEMAHWVAGVARDWSPAARETAQRAVIDVIACMIPGSQEPVTARVWDVAKDWGGGPCAVAGYPKSLSPPLAALINGTSAHALDFDDNFDPAKAHASAVLVPALMAAGDLEDAFMSDLLDAYIVGLQVMGRVGQAVNPFHRARGWHATATLGAIGAAAGCARLLRLDPEASAHAISMSTSLAGGFMSQFGTDTKPLHAGFAASGGVQAALFARGGLTAGAETLHGPTGLRALMVGPDVEALADEMVGKAEHGQTVRFMPGSVGASLLIEAHGLKLKRFPNCGSVHRALDGLLELRARHGFTPDEVAYVLVRAPDAHLRNLMYDDPYTPAEAKFSLEYNMAVGLAAGEVTLADFTGPAIARPQIRALFPKVRKEYVEALESDFPTEVHVQMKSGEVFETRIEMPVGSKSRPLSRAQIWAKYAGCLAATPQLKIAPALKEMLEAFRADLRVRAVSQALMPALERV